MNTRMNPEAGSIMLVKKRNNKSDTRVTILITIRIEGFSKIMAKVASFRKCCPCSVILLL